MLNLILIRTKFDCIILDSCDACEANLIGLFDAIQEDCPQYAKDYIGLHLWGLFQDFLGSDEEIELDAEKMATIKNYIQEFMDALPAVTNVLKEIKTGLCDSQ